MRQFASHLNIQTIDGTSHYFGITFVLRASGCMSLRRDGFSVGCATSVSAKFVMMGLPADSFLSNHPTNAADGAKLSYYRTKRLGRPRRYCLCLNPQRSRLGLESALHSPHYFAPALRSL